MLDAGGGSVAEECMSNYTNKAEILSLIFSRLRSKCALKPGADKPLLAAWGDIFSGEGRDEYDVVQNIYLVMGTSKKLKHQIKESVRFKDSHKKWSIDVVSNFDALFKFENFPRESAGFLSICSVPNCTALEIVGKSLGSEYNEATIDQVDAQVIITTLEEVNALVENSTVSVEMRYNLKKHISCMIWWLNHPEIIGLQDVFESAGAAMLVAKQIEEMPGASSENEKQNNAKIVDRMSDVAKKIGGVVGLVARGVDDIGKISKGAEDILRIIT